MIRLSKLSLYLIFWMTPFLSLPQVLEPAQWTVTLQPGGAVAGDTVSIVFDVEIDDKWYLYSSDFDPDLGPMVTEFEFVEDESYTLIGDIEPIDPGRKYDSLWEGEYTYFKETGQFIQKAVLNEADYLISGYYTYQVCSDVDGKCIPFDEPFELTSKKKEPQTEPTSGSNKVSAPPEKVGLLKQRGSTDPYALGSFMLVAFLAGLAALFTPCVFPMIPMTVTFFTGKNQNKKGSIKNSLFYGFSIILIYSLIGFIVAPFMGPEVANDLATGWVPNVIFFLVFVVFALSFFGLFEINLPHKWVNSVDKLGDKGGYIGVFFMALTLVLVSFSCTGPLVGSILVESAGQLSVKPVLGMVAFSAAFAIPFSLFALFPGALQKLPKSGGWLNSVKVVLGFLELALAFKFLSIADQAYHWHILDREVYLAIWIVIFTLMGFYLLGKIKLPGDSDVTTTSVPRLILAIITFSFVTYLIPGMFGAPLKALAGYLPPLTTHDFNLVSVIRENSDGGLPGSENEAICEEPKHANLLEWPHGLHGYFDYDQALSCAKKLDKPVFIDFTGHGCVNCREMEQRVWSDPGILNRLRENFVLLALYVDDKTELPESEWYESEYDGRIKKSIGKQNADFQITRFNNNAQPYYVILSPDEKLLADPTAYDLNIDNFAKFLDSSLEEYRNHRNLAKN